MKYLVCQDGFIWEVVDKSTAIQLEGEVYEVWYRDGDYVESLADLDTINNTENYLCIEFKGDE